MKMFLNIILVFIFNLLIQNNIFKVNCDPLIRIPSGDVQGIYLNTPKGKTYEAYLGVRYAQPPFGHLRFKEAKPVEPWIGKYNGSDYGSDCLQFSHFGYQILGSEDCLFINIYKPVVKSDNVGKLYDVVVHIHGGAFMFFSPKGFRPGKMMDHDIVYVSFNYRLGPLGFMSSGDKVLPGNLGLKDQVFALKWIKENIKHFNGDPNKVTLTGISAGGVSVHYHYLSPLSRGLFNQGISSSGSVTNPWALADDVPEKTKIIANKLGCPTINSIEMINCLSERPAEKIVELVPLFLGWLYNPFSPFGPIVEPKDSESPFLSRQPFDLLNDGDFFHVPWVCSFNSEEGLYPLAEFVDNPKLFKELEDNWSEYCPYLLDYNHTCSSDTKQLVTDKITKYYIKDKKITEDVNAFIQMAGDRIFGAGIVQSALLQASSSNAPVYLYRFSYRGKHSASEAFSNTNTNFGVCHGDDGGYIYEGKLFKMDETKDDREMGNRLMNLLITFIKTGVPNFFENEPLPTVKESLPNIRYFEISSPLNAKTETKSDLANVKFWSKIMLNEQLQLPSVFKDEL